MSDTSGSSVIAATSNVLTPEARSFKVKGDENNLVDNIEKAIKNTADNVVEKLNLNEPIPDSTKEFLDSARGKGAPKSTPNDRPPGPK